MPQQCLLVSLSRIFSQCPYATEGVAADKVVGIEFHHRGCNHIQKRFARCISHIPCGGLFLIFCHVIHPPLFSEDNPAFAIVILELLGGHILLEVDSQHPFEILLGGTTDGETVILDALFDAGEIAEHIGFLFAL